MEVVLNVHIGEPQRTIIVEPVTIPIPKRMPVKPEPVEEPEYEPAKKD